MLDHRTNGASPVRCGKFPPTDAAPKESGKNADKPGKLNSVSKAETYNLKCPENPLYLEELAKSTELALVILVPWCRTTQTPRALAPLSEQASKYILAIKASIEAANQAFSIATDAVNIATTLKNPDNESQVLEDDRQMYLNGMLAMAVKGHKTAVDCKQQFRNVRIDMSKLIDEAEASSTSTNMFGLRKSDKKLTLLKEGISVLESFSKSISDYVTWWGWMELSQNALQRSGEQMFINYSSLRNKQAVQQWEALRNAYADYKDKIEGIQDKHGELFADNPISAPQKVRSKGFLGIFGLAS
ncbi:hypothetical protein B0H34DRAFT_387823 [Crassisporium funariophilum]|nr:hypothetical protein B0H34DRAFT_387823 [Crassisporium funariophilum]